MHSQREKRTRRHDIKDLHTRYRYYSCFRDQKRLKSSKIYNMYHVLE